MPSSHGGNRQSHVVVIGAGIGGLTAGALLARRGYQVLVLDQAIVPGGCASTFKRRGFTFDVGATQVAGLEPGGIHKRIFDELEIDLPPATPVTLLVQSFSPVKQNPLMSGATRKNGRKSDNGSFPVANHFGN
jgi:phytoene dehydrogenase-like protein